jgi:SAM-dependent methyltransferase
VSVAASAPEPSSRWHLPTNRVERRWRPSPIPLYDRLWSVPLGAGLADAVAELAELPDRVVVVVGTGIHLIGARLAAAGHRVVCVDPTAASRTRTHDGATLVAGTVDQLPLRPASADLVIATNLLHRHPRPVSAALRLADLLAPRGRLVCTWPRPNTGPLAVATVERRAGARWSTVSAHVAGRVALGALTAIRRPPATMLSSAVRAAADAYGLTVTWLDVPQAAQTLAVADLPQHNWGRP